MQQDTSKWKQKGGMRNERVSQLPHMEAQHQARAKCYFAQSGCSCWGPGRSIPGVRGSGLVLCNYIAHQLFQ